MVSPRQTQKRIAVRGAYRAAYGNCIEGATEVYAESGTTDPLEASRWYGDETSGTWRTRIASSYGALDALTGQPSRY